MLHNLKTPDFKDNVLCVTFKLLTKHPFLHSAGYDTTAVFVTYDTTVVFVGERFPKPVTEI